MNNLSFLKPAGSDEIPKGDASLVVCFRDGTSEIIQGLSIQKLDERCPLLALAFEPSRTHFHHSIEDVTPEAVASLLRYAYCGHYVPEDLSGIPKSLLLHLHVYDLAISYELQELADQAATELMLDCELSCCSPHPPLDLAPAIDFVYAKLASQKRLLDTIVNYCVSCFLYHRLHRDPNLRRLAFNLRPFHQDLCRVNMDRGFVDEAASDIISLPFRPYDGSATAAAKALGDYLYEFFGDGVETPALPSRASNVSLATRSAQDEIPFAYPLRPARSESPDEKDGFSALALINRRRDSRDLDRFSQKTAAQRIIAMRGASASISAGPGQVRYKPMPSELHQEEDCSMLLTKAARVARQTAAAASQATKAEQGVPTEMESDNESFDMVSLDSGSVRYTPSPSWSGDENDEDDFFVVPLGTSVHDVF